MSASPIGDSTYGRCGEALSFKLEPSGPHLWLARMGSCRGAASRRAAGKKSP
jgi:hypothetical protein